MNKLTSIFHAFWHTIFSRSISEKGHSGFQNSPPFCPSSPLNPIWSFYASFDFLNFTLFLSCFMGFQHHGFLCPNLPLPLSYFKHFLPSYHPSLHHITDLFLFSHRHSINTILPSKCQKERSKHHCPQLCPKYFFMSQPSVLISLWGKLELEKCFKENFQRQQVFLFIYSYP